MHFLADKMSKIDLLNYLDYFSHSYDQVPTICASNWQQNDHFSIISVQGPFQRPLGIFLQFHKVSHGCSELFVLRVVKNVSKYLRNTLFDLFSKKGGVFGSFWGVPMCQNIPKIPQKQPKMPKKCQKLQIFETVLSQKRYFSRY